MENVLEDETYLVPYRDPVICRVDARVPYSSLGASRLFCRLLVYRPSSDLYRLHVRGPYHDRVVRAPLGYGRARDFDFFRARPNVVSPKGSIRVI